jgi:hypothetical protein
MAYSDFSFVGKVKNVMKRCACGNKNELFLRTMSEVSKITCEELEDVFNESLLQLDRCTNINREYVDSNDSNGFVRIS